MAVAFPALTRHHVGLAFSIFGEPYFDFGDVGVPIVMLLFGVFWRTLYEWFRRDPSNAPMMALFALNWPFMFVYMRGGIAVDYQRQVINVLPALAAMLLCAAGTAGGYRSTGYRRQRMTGRSTGAAGVRRYLGGQLSQHMAAARGEQARD